MCRAVIPYVHVRCVDEKSKPSFEFTFNHEWPSLVKVRYFELMNHSDGDTKNTADTFTSRIRISHYRDWEVIFSEFCKSLAKMAISLNT